MATSHNTFEKRQRERNRAARAAEKRAKRLERGSGEEEELDEEPDELAQLGSREFGHLDEAGLLDALAALHKRFDDKDIDFETFEKRKAAITAQLVSR